VNGVRIKSVPIKKIKIKFVALKVISFINLIKHSSYLKYWCTNGCRDQWFNDNSRYLYDSSRYIDKQTLPLEDAWYVEYRYDYRHRSTHDRYHLINRLKGIDQSILQTQAQTRENIQQYNFWSTISDNEARELAVTLGLVS
jgi:hypothetical protein